MKSLAYVAFTHVVLKGHYSYLGNKVIWVWQLDEEETTLTKMGIRQSANNDIGLYAES